ncbi:hypothetical protein PHYPSEUDO_003185 [Phytophthora pseudosyringae]|uniref:RxLR effector protein n=1 Tax=Phytophthora pseudosyringae TaxID=221518 RepID=A0A8T1VVD6_9STRA|nr:hypothetical protein PHYPSEUDO_003185 [Phytophthora pseudosyringae]
MRLTGFQLLILLVVISLVSSDNTPATTRGIEGVSLTSDDRTHFLPKRFLRDESTSDEGLVPSSTDNEERMGIKEAAGWLWNAMKIRVKMKLWLYRGMTPEQVLEKLKVASKTDKNYKYYSRYCFKYYVKYPGRVPSNVPAKTADDIMKARLSKWLEDNLTPPQVFKELGLTGTFASARGHPKYKYFDQYSKMWSDLQVRLSKAENGR